MKKRSSKKTVGMVAMAMIVVVIGIVISWNSVWASEDYMVKLDKPIKDVTITATHGSKKKTVKTNKKGEAIFESFIKNGEKYKISVEFTKKQKYYLRGAVINTLENVSEVSPADIDIEKKGYSFNIKDSEGQSAEVLLEEKEPGKLSEIASLQETGEGAGCVSQSGEGEVYIYNKKTDSVKVSVQGALEVGYKTEQGKEEWLKQNFFEIKSSTILTELYVKESEDAGWKEYNLSGETAIIIDRTAPIVSVSDADSMIYTSENNTDIKFKIENPCGDNDGSHSAEIDKIYYYKNEDKDKAEELKDNQDKTGSLKISVSNIEENKETKYHIYAVDKAGNESEEAVITVCHDTEKPEITDLDIHSENNKMICGEDSTKSYKEVTLDVKVEDTGSGAQQVVIKFRDSSDGEGSTELKAVKNGIASFVINKEIWLDEIECSDRAGNIKSYQFEKLLSEINEEKIKSSHIIVGETDVDILPKVTNIGNAESSENKIHEVSKTIIAVDSGEGKELQIEVKEENRKMGIQSIKVKGNPVAWDWIEKPYSAKTTVELEQLDLEMGDNNIEVAIEMLGGQEITKSLCIRVDKQPPVIKKDCIKITDAVSGELLKETNLGQFANKKVKVIISATDNTHVDTITLFTGEKEYKTVKAVEKEGDKEELVFEAEFEINVEETPRTYLLSAKARDVFGNECEQSWEENPLMLEKVMPDITISVPDATYGSVWYGGEVEFTVKIQDMDSGLCGVHAVLNGKEVKTSPKKYELEKTQSDEFKIDTSSAEREKDGSYTLNVSVTDNAGNERTISKKIYVDTEKPEIASFEFEADGYSEGEKTEFSVKERDYGYYFKENTKVTVRAKDTSPSSGLKSIIYYTVDKSGVKTEEKTKAVTSKGSISFVVPANFKGQIYAKPVDNVNHSAEHFVTPDRTIIENFSQHKKDSSIEFKRSKTDKKIAGKGAGRDLYKKDVSVTIQVSDRYSGIRKIEYSVIAPYDVKNNQKGAIEIDNNGKKTKNSASGWERSETEKNLVTRMTGKVKVTNNSNNIILKVKLTDRAGHVTVKKDTFSIDKVKPKIQISYDNNEEDKDFEGFYKRERTATVVVTERNFNAELVKYTASNKDGETPKVNLSENVAWKKKGNKKEPDKTTYTARVSFGEDGKYTWNISLKDRAGNAANKVGTQKFVVDRTEPVITVAYDNEDVQNSYYYKADRIATITIEEHNFEESRIKIVGEAKDDGKEVAFPETSEWHNEGDTHTANISYSDDAEYSFQIAYTDKAGNAAAGTIEDYFIMDKTEPEVRIDGIENESANRGKVMPVVTYTDVNLDVDTLDLELKGVNRGKVEVQGESQDIKNGKVFTFQEFEKKKEVDDIYTLVVSVTDYAGNKSPKKEISFSVNRFGSTYRFETEPMTSVVSAAQKGDCRYIQNEFDVVLKEINVDELKKRMPKIRMSKNGTSKELAEGQDYVVEHTGAGKKWSKRKWSEYTYRIDRSLFSEDGRYEVEVSSKDIAGNKNENIDEKKKASIKFAIDKTAPVIIPINLENDTQYPLDEKEVKVAVKDNLVIPDVKIYLNEKEVQYRTEGEYYTLMISSDSAKQNLKVVANDSAGNTQTTEIADFLVSTNLFVRWYNNLPLFAGTLSGIGILLALIIVLIIARKGKRKEEVH